MAIIDDNPIKVDKFCPGSNIPIVPISYIQKYMKYTNLVIIITAHNFKNEIISNLKKSGIHGKVVSYVPEVIEEYI